MARHPLSAPLGQVLALGDQTLMDRTGEHGDAMPADPVVVVLAGDGRHQSGRGAGHPHPGSPTPQQGSTGRAEGVTGKQVHPC
jgi:hypothetical protein